MDIILLQETGARRANVTWQDAEGWWDTSKVWTQIKNSDKEEHEKRHLFGSFLSLHCIEVTS